MKVYSRGSLENEGIFKGVSGELRYIQGGLWGMKVYSRGSLLKKV